MTDHHGPRPMGFVSSISDTDVKDDKHPKDLSNLPQDHNPLHHAAHYLKNAVTLESKSDEKRRESVTADHAHVNDHGGQAAKAEFWDKHAKHRTHGNGDAHETKEIAKEAHGKDGKARGDISGTLL